MRQIPPSTPQEIVGTPDSHQTPPQSPIPLFMTYVPTNFLDFETAGIASFIVELSSPQSSLHGNAPKAKIAAPPVMPSLGPDLSNQELDIYQPLLDPVIFNESFSLMPFDTRNEDTTAEHMQSFDDWLRQVEAGGMMMS